MFKRIFVSTLAFLIVLSGISQEFSQKQFLKHIEYLASDNLKGRKSGTPEDLAAAMYIRAQFSAYGAELLESEGFQYFDVISDIQLGRGNILRIHEKSYIPGKDFIPFPFSANGELDAEICFAGYGFDINEDAFQWNDYKNQDVKGKWVLILRGDPEPGNNSSPFIPYGDDRDKVITAIDKGAGGVIFVSGKSYNEEDDLVSLFYDKSPSGVEIPVMHIKRYIADEILAGLGFSIDSLESMIQKKMAPLSYDVGDALMAAASVKMIKSQTMNIVALFEGFPEELECPYIIIGAHYDHLGMGGTGSGSRALDSMAVHNGADDNASGVAGLLELARIISESEEKLKRHVIFVAFGAEEMGLLGSNFFVKNIPIPLNKVHAMINLDMIGRLKEDNSILIGGTGTAKEIPGILEDINETYDLQPKLSTAGFGPSDHAAFYAKNIPVFFISTGAHEDYHTPKDDIEFIDEAGAIKVLEYVNTLLYTLSDEVTKLSFTEAGPQERGRHGYRFKVTLGIMPGFGDESNTGLRVDGVRKDGSAYAGGMKKGDRIVKMNGKEVKNIYDYMHWLKEFKAGDVITVDVIRNEKKEVLIIQL